MSKLSFRARALDATKPLPIYHAVDLPDISEFSTINRTVPQMPTGMEKEEETERHLQEVIIAQQTNRTNKNVIIPTPENAIVVGDYEGTAATMERTLPPYIRVPGLPLEEDVPDYDLDLEDEEWLSRQTMDKPLSSLQFERMMDKLEKGSGNVVLSEREAQALLKDDEELVLAVYEYWLSKRLNLGGPLLPTVKQERRDGSACGSNPYIAFRKRTEKMQTRKNRKNDETAYMQMQKLKRDLDKAFTLTGFVKEREFKKYDMALVQMDIFKRRYMLQDWSGNVVSSLCPVATRSATSRQNSNVNETTWDGNSVLKVEADEDYDIHQVGRHEVLVAGIKRKKKSKKYFTNNLTESPIPDAPSTPERVSADPLRVSDHQGMDKHHPEGEGPVGKYAFKRRPYVKYHMARETIGSWPWINNDCQDPEEEEEEGVEFGCITTKERPPRAKMLRYSRLTLSGDYVGLTRRRIGRGGRVLFDRAAQSNDENLDNTLPESDFLDTSTTLATPLPPLCSSSSSSLDHYTSGQPLSVPSPSPMAASSAAHLPGATNPASPAVGEMSPLLVRESAALPPSGGQNVAGDGTKPPGGDKNKSPSFKSRHFVCKDQSSSSKSEVPSLDFIVPQSLAFAEASPFAPDGLNYHSPNPYADSSFSLFQLLPPSVSDSREEMTTFSSLPTSHFTLKPSSSDTEMDESPMSYWNQSGSVDRGGTDSNSWSWNHPFTGLGNDKQWHRSLSGNGSTSSRTSIGSFYTSHLALNNYGPGYRSTVAAAAAPRQKTNQQVQNDSHATSTSTKDVSRSSLSVTDSKTIVLTNAPASSQQQGVASGDKKKGENKGLQNHKLNGGNGMLKKWSSLSADRTSKKPLPDGTNLPVDPRLVGVVTGGSSGVARTKSVDELKSGAGAGSNAVGGRGSIGGMVNGQGGTTGELDKNKEGVPGDGNSSKMQGEPEREGQVKLSNEARGGVVKARPVSDQNPAPPASVTASQSKSVKSKPFITVRQSPPSEPVDIDIWSVSGPGNKIRSLNRSSQREKNHLKRLRKKPISTFATIESAKAVSSKFGIKILSKRSDSGILGSSSVGDLPMGLTAQNPAGVLLHSSSASSRSGSSTPTILNSIEGALAQQKLGALGTAMAAGLSGVKVTVPSAAKAGGETSIVTGANVASGSSSSASIDGTGAGAVGDQKRTTNANSISDGIVGHVTSQVDHVTASVGTNGTNFQEMFNSSKRKLSESTERGLKQALAGFMKHKLVKMPDCKVE